MRCAVESILAMMYMSLMGVNPNYDHVSIDSTSCSLFFVLRTDYDPAGSRYAGMNTCMTCAAELKIALLPARAKFEARLCRAMLTLDSWCALLCRGLSHGVMLPLCKWHDTVMKLHHGDSIWWSDLS